MSNYTKFFEHLTSYYPSTDTDIENTYGIIFEKQICIWFLKNDPIWKTQFKPETIMSPQDWGYGTKSKATGNVNVGDVGIDIVAEDHSGRVWGIQAKCYTNTIPPGEINKYLKAMVQPFYNVYDNSIEKFLDKGLLLVTDKMTSNSESDVKGLEINPKTPTITVIGPDQFEASPVNWFKSINKVSEVPVFEKYKPLPHQEVALKKIEAGWVNNDRGKCIMACGTGKTLVGLWAAEAVQSKLTLVMVPSLSLVNQIATEWVKHANRPISPLFVCSDKSVEEGADEYITNVSDLGLPVTTDENDIVSFFQTAPMDHRVIFSTYHSSEAIEKAQNLGAPKFDIIIADEAHHCVGKEDSNFARVLDGKKIKSNKRLFMTATPKYIKQLTYKKKDGTEIDIVSMDDEDIFGPYFHTLNFGDAIRGGLLSDYRVVVTVITEKDAERMIIEKKTPVLVDEIEAYAGNVAMMVSLIEVIEKYNLSHIITFHRMVKQAERLSRNLKILFPSINKNYEQNPPSINHVSGEMKTTYRTRLLKKFREADGGINILSNAKCLTEGVDVRAIDGVAFFEPKRSKIEILQAVGRAIRKNDKDTPGTIFIPVFIPEDEIDDPELVIQDSRFKDVWDVLIALRDHDQILGDTLDEYRHEKGETGDISGGFPKNLGFHLPERLDSSFFRNKLKTLMVMETTVSWHEVYGAFVAYKKEFPDTPVPYNAEYHGCNLGKWVGTQRTYYNKGTLSPERIKLLEEAGIIWDPFEEAWQQGYKAFVAYKKEFPDALIPQRAEYHGYNLGVWVGTQRQDKKNGALSDERKNLLEEAGIIWHANEEKWQQGYKAFVAYQKEFPDTSVPQNAEYHGFNLGSWVANQRTAYNKGTLSPERIKLLEEAGIIWDSFEEAWRQGYKAFVAYQKEFPDSPVPANSEYHGLNLGRWVGHQRTYYNKGTLSPERIKLLEEAGFVWDSFEEAWQQGYKALVEYQKEFPDTPVPQNAEYHGFNLGSWVANQRSSNNKGTLSPERKNLLEEAGIIWDANEEAWEQGYKAFVAYKKEFPDTPVPNNTEYHGYNLGTWVGTQRTYYNKGTLSPERKNLLEEAGFIWKVTQRTMLGWEQGYKAFVAYKKEFPDTPVPNNTEYHGYNLGTWIANQRTAKKKETLSPEKIKLLEKAGIVWVIKDRTIFSWDEAFDELKKYKEEFGHLYVPQNYINHQDIRLGAWITTLQRPRTINDMSQERKDKLNSIGFQWEDKNQQNFDFLISQIKKYKEKFGHALIPFNYISDDFNPFASIPFRKKNTKYKLGEMLKRIYSTSTRGSFSEKQLLELQQLGVELDKTPPDFVNKYQANMSFLKSIKDGFLITHYDYNNLPSEILVEERVNVLLESISAREALMIKKRYGLDNLYIKTLEAIGEEYGLSRERVRQIVAKAIKKVLQV